MTKYILKIYRGIPEKQYWEEFELTLRPFLNINSALLEIQKNPVNHKGQRVAPVAWENGCLEEVCGSCSMLVNSRPRQACTALVQEILDETKKNVIILAPLSKFPLVRDLVVDRTSMFESLKRVRAWIDADDALDRGFGPKISPQEQEVRYLLSTCMTCGCCSESCPQVSDRSDFIGPAPISQARLFNAHPVGALQEETRVRPLLEKGGIASCGNAQNCAKVCPKKIPLTESIAVMGRKATKQALKDLISLPDVK